MASRAYALDGAAGAVVLQSTKRQEHRLCSDLGCDCRAATWRAGPDRLSVTASERRDVSHRDALLSRPRRRPGANAGERAARRDGEWESHCGVARRRAHHSRLCLGRSCRRRRSCKVRGCTCDRGASDVGGLSRPLDCTHDAGRKARMVLRSVDRRRLLASGQGRRNRVSADKSSVS